MQELSIEQLNRIVAAGKASRGAVSSAVSRPSVSLFGGLAKAFKPVGGKASSGGGNCANGKCSV
jgi:hypothetical protein